MTSVPDWTAYADQLRQRSSVASKRFPLSNEQLARFRFARVQSAGRPDGTFGPDWEFAKPFPGFARIKRWRL